MIRGTQITSHNYLIKQLPSATAFIDSKLQVVHASDKWISDFDFSNRNVFGRTLHELFGGISDTWKIALENCLKGESGDLLRESYFDGNRDEKWFECSNIPWYDAKENIIGIIILTDNIVHRPNDNLKLEKLQLLLDTKSEVSKIGSWEYDITKNKLFWCNMTKIIHEVPMDFQPNIETAVTFYKEGYSKNTISMALYKATEYGVPWSERLQLVTAKGNEIWVVAAGKPIFENGRLIGVIGTFQNVNDQVLTEIKTKEREQLLQTLIDHLPLNVYIKDLESRKILVNKSECQWLGVAHPDQILGKTDFDIYDDTMASTFREEDLVVINSLRPILGKESYIIKSDGTATHCLVSKIPLIGTDGKAYGIAGISMDISDLKRKEEELRKLINVTSLQNKKLINFAHIVSHNLRSHTANFSMLLDFLMHEKDESEKQKIINMLINASDNLLETMDNLNEVVAISTNVDLKKHTINLNEKINDVEQNLNAFLKNNNATIINEIPDDVHIKVVPAYIENILMNFITNAVKYKRPEEPPLIKLSTNRFEDHTILSIQDNGQGIDLKKYGDKLFGMYKTFHNNPDARGIGLFITKNQIEAMNGKIMTHSEVGRGTTFKIYFNEKD